MCSACGVFTVQTGCAGDGEARRDEVDAAVESTAVPTAAAHAGLFTADLPAVMRYQAWDAAGATGAGGPALVVRRRPPRPGEWTPSEAAHTDAWVQSEELQRLGGDPHPPAPLRDQLFMVAPDGSVVIAEQRDFAEDVAVVFSPPLVVMPPTLAPGETFTQRLDMTVHPLRDRSKVRARGGVNQSITYEADERITTPAGVWPAHRLGAVFTAELGPTKVHNRTDTWFVEGVGVVAERRSERTTLLGVPVRTNNEAWMLGETGTDGR